MKERFTKNISKLHNCQAMQLVVDGEIYCFSILRARLNGRNEGKSSQVPQKSRQHTHNVYHLVIYTEGNGHCMLNSDLYPCPPGSIAFISPQVLHNISNQNYYTRLSQVTFELVNARNQQTLDLSFEKILSLYSGLDLILHPNWPIIPVHSDLLSVLNTEIEHIIRQLSYHTQEALFDALIALGRIFVILIHHCFSLMPVQESLHSKKLSKIKSYLLSNYNQHITQADLAKLANMSVRNLSRLFKEEFGVSPINFLIQTRIHEAMILLRSTEMQIQEIAEEVGYSDIYQFSKAFLKYCNQTPRSYRKKLQKSFICNASPKF